MTALTLPLFEPDAHAAAIARRDATWPHCQGGPLACLQCQHFAPRGYAAADEPGTCSIDAHACSAGADCTVPESFTPDTRTWNDTHPLYPADYQERVGASWARRAKQMTGKVLAAAITGDAAAASLLSSAQGVQVTEAEYTKAKGAA